MNMAKLSYSKLGLKPTAEIKILEVNDQTIEIKQYLPIDNVLELIANVLNNSLDSYNFYNSCKVYVYTTIQIILYYTNISITEKQSQNISKVYDALVSTGVAQQILDAIPEEQKTFIYNQTENIIKALYDYTHSAYGIMDRIGQDYSEIGADIDQMSNKIQNPENMTLIKDILKKLG